MAWITPRTAVTGEITTAAHLNETRDNLNALKPTTAEILAAETETNLTFDNMTTVGPTVTLTTATTVTCTLTAQIQNNTLGALSFMGVAISGATTRVADDDHAAGYESSAANDISVSSATFALTGLTAGSNTFTAKYRVTGGTATIQRRRVTIIGV